MLFSALQGLIKWTKHFSHLTKVHEQAVLKIGLQVAREGKHARDSVGGDRDEFGQREE